MMLQINQERKRNQMKKVLLPVLALLAVSACASQPGSIRATNVDSSLYSSLACAKIASKLDKSRVEEAQLAETQQGAATGDVLGVLLLGLPVGSWVGDDVEHQLAYAKGKTIALTEAFDANCE